MLCISLINIEQNQLHDKVVVFRRRVAVNDPADHGTQLSWPEDSLNDGLHKYRCWSPLFDRSWAVLIQQSESIRLRWISL